MYVEKIGSFCGIAADETRQVKDSIDVTRGAIDNPRIQNVATNDFDPICGCPSVLAATEDTKGRFRVDQESFNEMAAEEAGAAGNEKSLHVLVVLRSVLNIGRIHF